MKQPLESEIKRDIMSYLRALPGCYARILMVGVIPGRKNQSKGMPDIVGVIRGVSFWIEVKRPKGKTSPEQEEFITNWTRCGGKICVAHSLREVILFISDILNRTQ